MSTLEVVVGAQFGSEAKGHVVQRLTERSQATGGIPQVIRVAGPNAGHTGYDRTGRSWALRQVPVAAVTEDAAVLGIAAGSEIDLPVLIDEINRLQEAGLLTNKFIWISEEATLIDDQHKITEISRDHLVDRIGSTGKGIGAARADRIMRRGKRVIDDPEARTMLRSAEVAIAGSGHNAGASYSHTIIEGTQGFGLGLHAGFYPQCTSSDCRAVDFMAMAGIHPWQFEEVNVWAVARMYPIRVAGNSGPLANETSWAELGLPEEYTTVTKKVRRVGQPDWELVRKAVAANGGGPTVRLAITMADQMFPFLKDRYTYEPDLVLSEENQMFITYLAHIEHTTGAKIELVTTGPNTATFMRQVTA